MQGEGEGKKRRVIKRRDERKVRVFVFQTVHYRFVQGRTAGTWDFLPD